LDVRQIEPPGQPSLWEWGNPRSVRARRGVGTRYQGTINPLSERHFHSETLDFQGFGKIL
jgi:hypothetical protein